ncbi:MAG: CoA pyrophosphatase [Polyangiaceae bacterium]|nr:CoA pyrophosphatase [Polyangiaceae bacterium]
MRITRAALEKALLAGARPLNTGPIDTSGARPAAVAVPIVLEPEPLLYLVLRGSHLADHAGEIGFPGGKADVNDADLRATAAREMREEVGVDESGVTWLGELSAIPVITGRYLIFPFVALLNHKTELFVASGEIDEVLTMPLSPYVLGEKRIHAVTGEWRGTTVVAPHFPVQNRVLYGATAYITFELIARLAAALDVELPSLVLETDAPWGRRYRDI